MHKILFYNQFIICHHIFFILVINQLDAQNFVLQSVYFMPLHVSSTMCSSSGGQNCIMQHLVLSHYVGGPPVHRLIKDSQPVHGMATYRCDDTRVCIIHFWSPDDEHVVLETCRGMIGCRPVHRTATYRCDDTRGCIIQFWPPDDEHMVLETCRGMK